MFKFLSSLFERVPVPIKNVVRAVTDPNRIEHSTLTPQQIVAAIPLVQKMMQYDSLVRGHTKQHYRFSPRSICGGYCINRRLSIEEHDDDMDFTAYSIKIDGIDVMRMLSRHNRLRFWVVGEVEYLERISLANMLFVLDEELDLASNVALFESWPEPIKQVVADVFSAFIANNPDQRPNPAVEAVLDYGLPR